VRHAAEVRDGDVAGRVLAERERQLRVAVLVAVALEDFLDEDGLARGFETSTPTTGFPGIGARMRTDAARSAIARSSARFTMRDTFTPGAGSNSNVVITGPGRTATTLPATPKSASFVSRMRELAWSAASSMGCVFFAGASSSVSAGRR
jgi:hypothetical protein